MPIRKSRVSGIVASGTTADRPSNPSVGDTFFNGTLGVQEIYTSTGWLPATGANDFNVVLTGSETSVTLDKEYFAGAYTITSALSDTTLDVYLFDTFNNAAGYSNSPSINATANFNKIIVYGGTNGDLLSFSYKTTFTTSATTTDTFAAPYITSVSVADLPNIDDTTTITGGNFDTDVEVWFDGQNDYSEQAKSVVYGSSTSVVATRPDNLLEDNSPYTIRVVNPGTTSPTGSNRNKLIDSITAGADPIWNTASGALSSGAKNIAYSVQLSATDPDGTAVAYSVVSGFLPTGLSINSSTGEISGTPTSVELASFIVSATDVAGNVTNRSFEIEIIGAIGGTSVDAGGYRYHLFASSGTLEVLAGSLDVEVLAIAGGGGSSTHSASDGGGGGGGAGGVLLTTTSLSNQNYSVFVGAGGSNSSGTASYLDGLTQAVGGGRGGSYNSVSGANGGSGGGGAAAMSGQFGTGTPGQGNDGGYGGVGNPAYGGGGGGGAGSAGGSTASDAPGVGGNGTNLYSAWTSVIAPSMSLVPGWTAATSGGYIAGGGGGGTRSAQYASSFNGAAGGSGGGGTGAGAQNSNVPTGGVQNTGGGAGGSSKVPNTIASGGSGIVIVRYAI